MKVEEIKKELRSRISVCKIIANEGYSGGDLKKKMRTKIITLTSVLSWITGQEQLSEDEPRGWTTVTTLRKDKKT